MNKKYKLEIHPNWGYSRANYVFYDTLEEAKESFDSLELGGAGNIVSVYLYEGSKLLESKHYKEEE